MKRPKFLQVLPDDVARVGAEGACVLALLRYVTSLDGEHNGRLLIDGEMWWQASYTEVGEALGMNRQLVGRTVRQLESDKALLTCCPTAFAGDQRKAYRVPDEPPEIGADQQCSESNTAADQQYSNVNDAMFINEPDQFKNEPVPVQKRTGTGSNMNSLPLSGELNRTTELKEGEEGAVDIADVIDITPTTPPSQFCPKHPKGADRPCAPCGDARRYRDDWLHTREGKAWRLREETDTNRIRMQAKSNAQNEQIDYLTATGNVSELAHLFPGAEGKGLSWQARKQREEQP